MIIKVKEKKNIAKLVRAISDPKNVSAQNSGVSVPTHEPGKPGN